MEFKEKEKVCIELYLNRKMEYFTEDEDEMLTEFLDIQAVYVEWEHSYIDCRKDGVIELYIYEYDNVLNVLNSDAINVKNYNPNINYKWGKLEKFKPKTYEFEGKKLTKEQILEQLGE